MSYPATLPDPTRDAQFYSGVSSRRLLAWVIDFILVGILTVMFSLVTFGLGFFVFGAAFVVIDLSYRTITIASGSATLGMRMMGIELRNTLGERMGFGGALVHTILYQLSIGTALIQTISVLMMIGSARGQGLHDMLLGAVMINRPAD